MNFKYFISYMALYLFFLIQEEKAYALTVNYPLNDLNKHKYFTFKSLDKTVSLNYHIDSTFFHASLVSHTSIELPDLNKGIYIVCADNRYFDLLFVKDGIIVDSNEYKEIKFFKNLLRYPNENINDSLVLEYLNIIIDNFSEVNSNYLWSMIADYLLLNKIINNELYLDVLLLYKGFEYEVNIFTDIIIRHINNVKGELKSTIKEIIAPEIIHLFQIRERIQFGSDCLKINELNLMYDNLIEIRKKLGNKSENFQYLFVNPISYNTNSGIYDVNNREVYMNDIIDREYTIIYFWGTWCGPCINISKTVLPEIYKKIIGSDISIITIGSENKANFNNWLIDVKKSKSKFMNFIAISDSQNGWSGNALNGHAIKNLVNMIPNFMIVNRNGEIILRNDISGSCVLAWLDQIQ